MATDTMSLVEQCQEILRRTGGQASTALATLMLACQMNVANAQTAPVSPADSAIATAAKGLEY